MQVAPSCHGLTAVPPSLHRQLQTFPHRSVCRTMSPKSPRFICRRQRFGDFAPRVRGRAREVPLPFSSSMFYNRLRKRCHYESLA